VSVWQAALLGFVQGATEFLPVSSSGHLVIAQTLLDVNARGVLFEVVVHLATLVSIVVVYRRRLVSLTRGVLARERASLEYVGLLALASVPVGVVGLIGLDAVEALFDDPEVTGIALLVTASFLWSSKYTLSRAEAPRPGWAAAVLIGLAQSFALVPGISRSGATVVAALWLGVETREAAAFSFLMALPAIAGAAVLEAPELAGSTGLGAGALGAGALVATVTGVLAIRTFVTMLGRGAFHLFAPYCALAGAGFLALLALR